MKFQIDKKKIIPNINEYIWTMLSVVITVYLFKPLLLKVIPQINTLHSFYQLSIWIFIVIYFKDLIVINRNGRDLF